MMSRFYRLLAFVLCVCMLFSFAACGEDAPAKADDDITPPAEDTPATDEPTADEPTIDEPSIGESATDEPTEPETPTEPEKPTEPEQPSEPSEPTESDVPVDPDEYYVPIMHIAPPFEDARIAIRSVLLDGDMLYDTDGATQVSLLEYCINKKLCNESDSLVSLQFALVDLNTDGVNECIVSSKDNSSANYVILFYDGSQVRGYNPSYTELSNLKADGTALAQTSVVSAYFDYYQLKYNILTENADSEALANQSSKSDPLWNEINQTGVEKVLGKAEEWSSDEAKAALALYDKVLDGELDTVDVMDVSHTGYVNRADKYEVHDTINLDINNDGIPELFVYRGKIPDIDGIQVLYVIDGVVYRDHLFSKPTMINSYIRRAFNKGYPYYYTLSLSTEGLVSSTRLARSGPDDQYIMTYQIHDKEVTKDVYFAFLDMMGL